MKITQARSDKGIVTFSIGVTTVAAPKAYSAPADLVDKADEALYLAGRRVEIAWSWRRLLYRARGWSLPAQHSLPGHPLNPCVELSPVLFRPPS